MTPELWVAILNFAVKFGIDAALTIGNAVKNQGATIDDAIGALQDIQKKSAADYLTAAGGPKAAG